MEELKFARGYKKGFNQEYYMKVYCDGRCFNSNDSVIAYGKESWAEIVENNIEFGVSTYSHLIVISMSYDSVTKCDEIYNQVKNIIREKYNDYNIRRRFDSDTKYNLKLSDIEWD